jgi:ribosomal protein S18 acetylase RimI-like enzyme
MMQIRPIVAGELAAFAAAGHPQHTDNTRQYLDQMLEAGSMRLDWCFVAEEDGRILGRVAYWTLPKIGIPLDIILLDAPWDDDDLAIGTELLQQTSQRMRAAGATDIEYVLDQPPQWPQWQYAPEQRQRLLTQLGFDVVRNTLRFEWQSTERAPVVPGRLSFRSFDEVGAPLFRSAIERVTSGTLDQRLASERAEFGAQAAAGRLLEEIEKMIYDPSWWQLAYAADGELVGLVMPSRNPTFAVIGYIGVVPEQRGRGYIDDLLAQATATLAASGASAIRADTDVANLPMAHAFQRAGYQQFATRREYMLRYQL